MSSYIEMLGGGKGDDVSSVYTAGARLKELANVMGKSVVTSHLSSLLLHKQEVLGLAQAGQDPSLKNIDEQDGRKSATDSVGRQSGSTSGESSCAAVTVDVDVRSSVLYSTCHMAALQALALLIQTFPVDCPGTFNNVRRHHRSGATFALCSHICCFFVSLVVDLILAIIQRSPILAMGLNHHTTIRRLVSIAHYRLASLQSQVSNLIYMAQTYIGHSLPKYKVPRAPNYLLITLITLIYLGSTCLTDSYTLLRSC